MAYRGLWLPYHAGGERDRIWYPRQPDIGMTDPTPATQPDIGMTDPIPATRPTRQAIAFINQPNPTQF